MEQGKSIYFDRQRARGPAPQGPADPVEIWQEAFTENGDEGKAARLAMAKFTSEVRKGQDTKDQVLAKNFEDCRKNLAKSVISEVVGL